MQRITLILLITTLAAGLIGCGKSTTMNTGTASAGDVGTASDEPRKAASPDDFSTDPITGDRATLLVYGMSCPLCATNVDQQLLAVPGVSAVDVDLGNGWVTVNFKEGAARPSKRDLAHAIVESGMTIVDVESN